MRKVDAWVGLPMCLLLDGWRKLWSIFRTSDSSNSAPGRRGILFVKLAEQGSTVLAYPALQRAVEMVGRENVYFLVFEQNRFILDAMEVIPPENVVSIPADGIWSTMVQTLKAVFRLRRMRLDAAIDLEFFARSSAILSYLSGATRRVGLHAFAGGGPWRGHLMTHPVLYNPHFHTAQVFLGQVEALDQPAGRLPALDLVPRPLADLPRGRYQPDAEVQERARSILQEVCGQSDVPRLVLLNANCSDLLPLRKWDEPNYVDLARRLLDALPDLHIAFTGAPAEAPKVAGLVQEIDSPRCHSLAGKTTIRELLAIYGLSSVLVTNDSGPAHFATLTPIHIVTLFGPETPALFRGLSEGTRILWAGTACSPCVSAYNNRVSTCRDNVCMQRISVDQVFATITRILHEQEASPWQVLVPKSRVEQPSAVEWKEPKPAAEADS